MVLKLLWCNNFDDSCLWRASMPPSLPHLGPHSGQLWGTACGTSVPWQECIIFHVVLRPSADRETEPKRVYLNHYISSIARVQWPKFRVPCSKSQVHKTRVPSPWRQVLRPKYQVSSSRSRVPSPEFNDPNPQDPDLESMAPQAHID